MNPLVSIVTPAYNAAPYIGETAESVFSQTWKNWEWIIVNDGSTDQTAALIEGLAQENPQVRVIHQPNSGVSVSRNRGIAEARGTFIAFLDADDLWHADNLRLKMQALESSGAGWAYSNMQRLMQESGTLVPSEPGKSEDVLNNLLRWNGEVIPGISSNVVVRREALGETLRFDPQLSTAADQDFAFYLAAAQPSVFLPDVLLTYRILGQSMSRNLAKLESDHLYAFRKAARNGIFESDTFRRKCFANLYLILAGNWWVNGNNKKRGLKFIAKAVAVYPPVLWKLITKGWRRITGKNRS